MLSEATRVIFQGDMQASGPIPTDAGVYAVYDSNDVLQYIGLTRKVPAGAMHGVLHAANIHADAADCQSMQLVVSVVTHKQNLPEQVQAVRYAALPGASREALTDAWKAWMQAAGACWLLH